MLLTPQTPGICFDHTSQHLSGSGRGTLYPRQMRNILTEIWKAASTSVFPPGRWVPHHQPYLPCKKPGQDEEGVKGLCKGLGHLKRKNRKAPLTPHPSSLLPTAWAAPPGFHLVGWQGQSERGEGRVRVGVCPPTPSASVLWAGRGCPRTTTPVRRHSLPAFQTWGGYASQQPPAQPSPVAAAVYILPTLWE